MRCPLELKKRVSCVAERFEKAGSKLCARTYQEVRITLSLIRKPSDLGIGHKPASK